MKIQHLVNLGRDYRGLRFYLVGSGREDSADTGMQFKKKTTKSEAVFWLDEESASED